MGGQWGDGQVVEIWQCNSCWNQQWMLGGGVVVWGDEHAWHEQEQSHELLRVASTHPLTCPNIPGPSPGPSPTPAGTCQNGWPVFDDQKSLAVDPWGKYFKSIY